ncbi:C-C motif chemokine 4-like [Tenrec ecaudatus]|uniref:C-C motif chemokine 4-like n=1 Tax=Tenrec ecaudatus TaxID=94439 RepID=UPI003F59C672
MKVSTAILCFLSLAVDFGSPFRITDLGTELEPTLQDRFGPPGIIQHGLHFHRPSDCCLSYTPRKIRCVFMASYYETSSGCSRPGVIFTTKRGKEVCANPLSGHVQDCMNGLLLSEGATTRELVEEKSRIAMKM